MTNQINLNTASQLFDTEVTIKFQNHQFLMNTIEERHGTTGDATNVPVSDIIEMQQQTYAPVDIPVTPVNPTNVMIVPYNYALKTVIGGGEKTLFAYDKIVDHAKLHAKAAGRMCDYIKINSLFTYSGFGSLFTVAATVGVNTGMNEGKLAQALSYLGVDIRTLGSNGINTIPFTTSMSINTYLTPVVNKEAMVQIFNRDVQTSITWVPQNDRWELLTVMTSGAQVIQANGIALVTVKNPYVAN